ncbi:transposase [Bacillus sp. JJ1127]|uniref:transposase n=1 Tax=Bacillus sp. JJ1127 TaxID=3122952 RepID=UPI002FFE09EB
MKQLRRRILNEISNLEYTHCFVCPLNNLSINYTDQPNDKKQRNYKHCKGCSVYKAIRAKGDRLNLLSKKSTFNKVRERYMENPLKYLQYKEYPLEEVVKETGLTRYELRKLKKQLK